MVDTKRSLLLLTACVATCASWAPSARANVPSTPGQALAGLPDVVLWHLKVFKLFPENYRAYNQAVAEAWDALGPGEEVEYDVLMRLESDGTPLRFEGLARSEQGRITHPDTRTVGRIRLAQARYILCRPTPFIDEESLEHLKSRYPNVLGRITLADLQISEETWSNIVGCSNGGFMDLLDTTARAGGTGLVTLVAHAEEDTYRVFNLGTGKIETERRRAKLEKLGTTVYLLVTTPGNHYYVIVYGGLKKAVVEPGCHVKAGNLIGEFAKEAGFWEIWRVHCARQFFLSPLDTSKPRPYCIGPICLQEE